LHVSIVSFFCSFKVALLTTGFVGKLFGVMKEVASSKITGWSTLNSATFLSKFASNASVMEQYAQSIYNNKRNLIYPHIIMYEIIIGLLTLLFLLYRKEVIKEDSGFIKILCKSNLVKVVYFSLLLIIVFKIKPNIAIGTSIITIIMLHFMNKYFA